MLGKLKNNEIEYILSNHQIGRIGCYYQGKTYVVPINYIFDGKNIIAHSRPGMKIRMMRNNPQVCFEVDEIQDQFNWKSVILWGEYRELTDARERYQAMKHFANRTLQIKEGPAGDSSSEGEFLQHTSEFGPSRPVIYKILIQEKTGRFEKK